MRFLIVFSFIFLVGCSRNQMVLRFADTYIAYKINSEFDFSGDEKSEVRKLTHEILEDFKGKSLPELNTLNSKFKNEFVALDGATADKYLVWLRAKNEELGEYFRGQSQILKNRIERFAKLVSESRWKSFQNHFEEANLKMLEETPDQSRVLESIEEFWGDLSAEQVNKVKAYTERYPLNPELRVINRRHQMKLFVKKLGSSYSSEKFAQVLQEWMDQPESWSEPTYKKEIDQRREDLLILLSELLASSSVEQRKHILKRFTEVTNF